MINTLMNGLITTPNNLQNMSELPCSQSYGGWVKLLSPMDTLLGNNNAAVRLKTINNKFVLLKVIFAFFLA